MWGPAARAATRHMIELPRQLHQLAPTDAYLLCSVCGDRCIIKLVNPSLSVVFLFFLRFAVA